jgi:hypothetical protein
LQDPTDDDLVRRRHEPVNDLDRKVQRLRDELELVMDLDDPID